MLEGIISRLEGYLKHSSTMVKSDMEVISDTYAIGFTRIAHDSIRIIISIRIKTHLMIPIS